MLTASALLYVFLRQLDIADVSEPLGSQQLLKDLGRVANYGVHLESDGGYFWRRVAGGWFAVRPTLGTPNPPRPKALAPAMVKKRRRLCEISTTLLLFRFIHWVIPVARISGWRARVYRDHALRTLAPMIDADKDSVDAGYGSNSKSKGL